MEEGATLVNVSRDLFMNFIAAKPRTLQIYLHKVGSCSFLLHTLIWGPCIRAAIASRSRTPLICKVSH